MNFKSYEKSNEADFFENTHCTSILPRTMGEKSLQKQILIEKSMFPIIYLIP